MIIFCSAIKTKNQEILSQKVVIWDEIKKRCDVWRIKAKKDQSKRAKKENDAHISFLSVQKRAQKSVAETRGEWKWKMHTLANKISARERETAPKYYYKVFVWSSKHFNLVITSGRYLFVQIFTFLYPKEGTNNRMLFVSSSPLFHLSLSLSLFHSHFCTFTSTLSLTQREEETTWLQKMYLYTEWPSHPPLTFTCSS